MTIISYIFIIVLILYTEVFNIPCFDMRFIVTAIGSFSADCVIRNLKGAGHYIVGCDIYEGCWHAVSRICDSFYKAPYATDERAYVDFLLDVSCKESINHIIPLTDLEVDVLNKYRQEFENVGVVLYIQSPDCLAVARDKDHLCKLFENDVLVHVPKTVRLENWSNCSGLAFPLIAKPVNGRSSEGLFKIFTENELMMLSGQSNYIVQQMINGTVFTVDYVRDQKGMDFAVPREELLRTKNGAGTTVRVVNDQILSDTVSYIGSKLNVCGCVNMEFVFDSKSNLFFLIDINPRFSAGVAFTCMVGYDMVTSHIRCFEGKSILSPVIYKEQIITKRYIEEVLWTQTC